MNDPDGLQRREHKPSYPRLGPTGNDPPSPPEPAEQGSLVVAVHHCKGRVVIHLGQLVMQVSPEQADQFAALIHKHAAQARA